MATIRNVVKSPLVEQDVTFGIGQITQTRADSDYTVDKLAVSRIRNTLADLVALDADIGEVVQSLGRDTANDGGAAPYMVVAGGTGVVDNILFTDLANGNQVQRLPIPEQPFSTIAEAKVAAWLGIGDTVKSEGYTTSRGTGRYRVVAGGTGIDDGGSYHDMTNGNQLELIVEDDFSLAVFGAIGDGVTNNPTQIQAAFNFMNSSGFPLRVGKGVFLSPAISVTTTNPITIIGDGKGSSEFLFSNTDGITINQSSSDHFINIQGIGIKTNTVAVGEGLKIDGSSQIVSNLIEPRDVQRGAFKDIFVGGQNTSTSFSNCLDFISFGWFNINGLETRGAQPVDQTVTAPLGTGILLRGNGQPVEMFISDFWQYYHGFAIRTPDALEGLSLDKFNVVACDNGFIFGITDADTLGVTQPKTLGFTVSNGHINCRGEPMNYGELSNQNKIDNILLYIREGTYTTGNTTGLTMTNGGNNNINDLTFIIVDNLVSRTSFTPLQFIGQNTNNISNINVTAGTSTQITNICDARNCQRSSFSNFAATATTGSIGDYFITDNTTINCSFSAVPFQGLTVGMVDNTADTNINTVNQNFYNMEYLFTGTAALVGGTPTETVSVAIPSWFLSQKTTDAQCTVSSLNGSLDVVSTYLEATSTAINVSIQLASVSGVNLNAGSVRLNVKVKP